MKRSKRHSAVGAISRPRSTALLSRRGMMFIFTSLPRRPLTCQFLATAGECADVRFTFARCDRLAGDLFDLRGAEFARSDKTQRDETPQSHQPPAKVGSSVGCHH